MRSKRLHFSVIELGSRGACDLALPHSNLHAALDPIRSLQSVCYGVAAVDVGECARDFIPPRFTGDATSLTKRAQIGSMLALVAAASMWFYVDRILVGFQVADAAARERPRGNLSDLYPRWLGARELLLHQRNPYGDDITIEIQKGYYGRALDPARPNDPKDQQGFAYPVYVVFLLAPFVGFPFHTVQLVFYWTLIALTAISVWLWLRVLRWRRRCSPLPAASGSRWEALPQCRESSCSS